MGSPPHVRGPPYIVVITYTPIGITPACAGTTLIVLCSPFCNRDHPRMCGDHLLRTSGEYKGWGSPPHVRGPQSPVSLSKCQSGITPACAGTTRFLQQVKVNPWDHPRMCGDHCQYAYSTYRAWGSPPHVRGPQMLSTKLYNGFGITPACAGTT